MDDLETRIIDAARTLFIEKGYAETSMSEIAERVGIARPNLHYYFRTKERIFHAVFGLIVQTVAPRIESILGDTALSIPERTLRIVEAYYGIFRQNPALPLFLARESTRAPEHLIRFLQTSQVGEYFLRIRQVIEQQMQQGTLRRVPLKFLFYNFYGLLTFPFFAKNLTEQAILEDGENFDDTLTEWMPYIAAQMERLLKP